MTDRTDALELARLLLLADNIVAHGSNIAYPSRASAQNVRNVVRELAAALRVAPQPAGLRCDRCGSLLETTAKPTFDFPIVSDHESRKP